MKSWKTTLAGILAGAPVAIQSLLDAYNSGKSFAQLAIGVGVILIGVYAKDKNVTGGTVQQ